MGEGGGGGGGGGGRGGCTHPTHLCSYPYDKKRKLNFLPAFLACLKPCI